VPVQRLNHAVLYVRDVDRSAAFYRGVLGFRVKVEMPGRAVFLQAEGSTNDHDLGLFAVGQDAGPSGAGRGTVGLYHLAWEVDPDGLEFEVSWLLPVDLISPEVQAAGATTRPLDLEAEIARYGGQTRGGVGVSVPAVS
jgi:catechol 2,3-dioxygenase-like lactoylglutathione lyase family enzyme